MPVSTRSRANSRANESELRAEISHGNPPQDGLSTVEVRALEDQNAPRNISDIGDVPIPNVPIGLPLGSAPPLMLLQQHMDVSELRELVYKLSDNQASMLDYLQSMIEPHPDRDLDSLHLPSHSIV